MPFAYYRRLSPYQQAIYDRSDRAGVVRVPGGRELAPVVADLQRSLAADDRAAAEAAAQRLVDSLLRRLHVPLVTVRVLAIRPSNHREELHGLYEYGGGRKQPVISVWMRTAQRRQVVAFRTFVRTLLHEVVHHLDYQLLKLADSFHTAGFYKRAEALYRQLVPAETAAAAAATEVGPDAGAPPESSRAPRRPAKPRQPADRGRPTGTQPAPPASVRRTPVPPLAAGSPVPVSPRPKRGRAPEPASPHKGSDIQPMLPFMDE